MNSFKEDATAGPILSIATEKPHSTKRLKVFFITANFTIYNENHNIKREPNRMQIHSLLFTHS